MVTFTEEILNGKLHFLCSAYHENYIQTKVNLQNISSINQAAWLRKRFVGKAKIL